jgi:hypothetical protein
MLKKLPLRKYENWEVELETAFARMGSSNGCVPHLSPTVY